MIIQRHKPFPVKGQSIPYQPVFVQFLNVRYETTADLNGVWSITLPSLPAGGPYEMTIKEIDTTIITDILIGDVWVLGGQSNMELPIRRTLDRYQKEIQSHHYPFIRQFNVPQNYDFSGPTEFIDDRKWIKAVEEEIDQFSAIGYFFALSIYQSENVPIGLILSAVGGTPAHAWLSEKTYMQLNPCSTVLEELKDKKQIETTIAEETARMNCWHHHLNASDPGINDQPWFTQTFNPIHWLPVQLPSRLTGSLQNYRGSIWFRKEIYLESNQYDKEALLKLGTIIDADETYLNGVMVGTTGYKYPPRRYPIKRGLLKAGKNVLVVRVICKESNGGFILDMPYELTFSNQSIDLKGEWHYQLGAQMEPLQPQTFFQYNPTGLYNGMIAPLKQLPITGFLWSQGESDTYDTSHYEKTFQAVINDWRTLFQQGELPFLFTQLANFNADSHAENWPVIREKQRQSLSLPCTAMAVTIDIGEKNDLHPQNKQSVGERLALCAQYYAYGRSIVYSGPAYSHSLRSGKTLILFFTHIGQGLLIKQSPLRGFTLCEEDGVYHVADASVIDDNTVQLSHPTIRTPLHARYAWSDNPDEANLYNSAGLPASPFTTEDSI